MGDCFDLVKVSMFRALASWITHGLVWFILIAIPCTPDSSTSNVSRSAEYVRQRERLMKNILRIISLCIQYGVYFLVENPRGSKVWRRRALQELLARASAADTLYDDCAFGTAYLKPQRLSGTLPGASRLGITCTCGILHEVLQGVVRVVYDGWARWLWKTSLAGRYPAEFCHLGAKVCKDACPFINPPAKLSA